jgi:hypothetical protein
MMVAAYTAWLGVNRPEEVTNIGDKTEGKISLPISELRGKY